MNKQVLLEKAAVASVLNKFLVDFELRRLELKAFDESTIIKSIYTGSPFLHTEVSCVGEV